MILETSAAGDRRAEIAPRPIKEGPGTKSPDGGLPSGAWLKLLLWSTGHTIGLSTALSLSTRCLAPSTRDAAVSFAGCGPHFDASCSK